MEAPWERHTQLSELSILPTNTCLIVVIWNPILQQAKHILAQVQPSTYCLSTPANSHMALEHDQQAQD